MDEMPLFMAVRAYGQDIISFLLDQGAIINSTFYNLQHLPMAVQRELDTHESVIGLPVQRGADSTSRILWEYSSSPYRFLELYPTIFSHYGAYIGERRKCAGIE
jgi:hypothetical protein